MINQLITALRQQIQQESTTAHRHRTANAVAGVLSDELRRAGMFKTISSGSGSRKEKRIERIQFEEPLLLVGDELWIPVKLSSLPQGMLTDDLRKPELLRTLQDRLNSSIRIDTLPNGKICFVVRAEGVGDFPDKVRITDLALPEDAPPLAFPLGIDRRGQPVLLDLTKQPHLLVVGATNKGKSTLIHNMITTWIARNTAEDLELWLADHKGGAELNRYRALMGKGRTMGIVRKLSYKPEDTIDLLNAAQIECERRLERFRQANASDLVDYYRQTGERMRRIVLLIDEIFFLMLNRERIEGKTTVAQYAEHLLAKLASAGRAPGIHMVIGTQKTGKDVLTSLITANFEVRLVFSVADMYQSIYVVGNSDAVGMPAGRLIYHAFGANQQIQSPLITPEQTRLIISRIQRYGPNGGLNALAELRKELADAKLLVLVSSEHLDGRFDRRGLTGRPEISSVLTHRRVMDLTESLIQRGVVVPGGKGRPTRLSPAFVNRPELLDALYQLDTGSIQEDLTPSNTEPRAIANEVGSVDLSDDKDKNNKLTLDLVQPKKERSPTEDNLPESIRKHLNEL